MPFTHRRPSPQTLRWVERSLGGAARVVAWRRMTGGIVSTVHRLTVDSGGHRGVVVLRRYEHASRETAALVEHETAILRAVHDVGLPAPEPLAADPEGRESGGHPPPSRNPPHQDPPPPLTKPGPRRRPGGRVTHRPMLRSADRTVEDERIRPSHLRCTHCDTTIATATEAPRSGSSPHVLVALDLPQPRSTASRTAPGSGGLAAGWVVIPTTMRLVTSTSIIRSGARRASRPLWKSAKASRSGAPLSVPRNR